MKTVPLYGKKAAGRVALVDDEDYDMVMQYRWHVVEGVRPGRSRPHGPYAYNRVWRNKQRKAFSMHGLITGYRQTDHINHNGLDNRRENLRSATDIQNIANKRPTLTSTSGYKGVWRYAKGKEKPWAARICIDGHRRSLGCFATPEEAARAYDVAARAAWGEYAYLNFP